MKDRKILGCIASCLLLAGQASAQQALSADFPMAPQSSLVFQQFPPKKMCNTVLLEKLFTASGAISLAVDSDYILHGNIISHVHPNNYAETINIRLTNFPKTMLTVSRIRLENGSVRFTGHVLSQAGKDALVLSIEDGKYYFLKTEQRLLLTE